jgi:hypothetical protein
MLPDERPSLASSAKVVGPLAKNMVWRAAFGRWPARSARELSPGYTLLMPLPGDMPVFARLALANVAAQDRGERAEILVIPDGPSPGMAKAVAACAAETGLGDVRVIELPPVSRALGQVARSDPATNYFLQLHAGVSETATTHALLHDADLFLTNAGFLARHHRRCAERGLACLGVSPAWDDWLREHGLGHVVATWELMFDVRWMRSFAPWRHRSHFAWVDGQWHGFDVTLCTQAKTVSHLCEVHPSAEDSFVHFNWVIGGYRRFQGSHGQPVEDTGFNLLLIRLMIDALDGRLHGVRPTSVDVPPADELARGLTDPSRQVTYRGAEPAANYGPFREKIRRLYRAPLFDDAAVEAIEQHLSPFDAALL